MWYITRKHAGRRSLLYFHGSLRLERIGARRICIFCSALHGSVQTLADCRCEQAGRAEAFHGGRVQLLPLQCTRAQFCTIAPLLVRANITFVKLRNARMPAPATVGATRESHALAGSWSTPSAPWTTSSTSRTGSTRTRRWSFASTRCARDGCEFQQTQKGQTLRFVQDTQPGAFHLAATPGSVWFATSQLRSAQTTEHEQATASLADVENPRSATGCSSSRSSRASRRRRRRRSSSTSRTSARRPLP